MLPAPRLNDRRPRRAAILGLFAIGFMAVSTAATGQPAVAPGMAPTDPTGEWLVAERVARIQIVNCDGKYWGVVSWEMQPGTDSHNPDAALRTRPTLGMPVLLGMTQSKPNQWDGQIYNSKDGHTYSANISLLDPNTLKVQGCFLGFLCGGENWSRVQPEPVAAAPPPKSSRKRPPPTNASKSPDAGALGSAQDICLRIAGPPGLTHERRLK